MMEGFFTILGLLIWVGQVLAIVACFSSAPKQWIKICGGIGAIMFCIAMIGTMS